MQQTSAITVPFHDEGGVRADVEQYLDIDRFAALNCSKKWCGPKSLVYSIHIGARFLQALQHTTVIAYT
jgi:hypothetical protein